MKLGYNARTESKNTAIKIEKLKTK